MKLAVTGSREIGDYEFIEHEINKINPTKIISGGAKGVDSCARQYAINNGIEYEEFLPDYKRFGKGAPLKRNRQIVEASEVVLAIWDGRSRGTQNALKHARELGKKTIVVLYE